MLNDSTLQTTSSFILLDIFHLRWFGLMDQIRLLQIISKTIKLICELIILDLVLNSDVVKVKHLLWVCRVQCALDLEEMWGESLSYLTWTGHPWHDQNLLQIVPHVSSNRHKIQCHCNLLCPSTHVLFKVISACKRAHLLLAGMLESGIMYGNRSKFGRIDKCPPQQ